MGIVNVIAKKFGSNLAKKTARGAEKEALKKEFKEQGISEIEATNKAHLEVRKAEGKDTAMRKTEVKQNSKNSKFISEDTEGGNKTLALEKRNVKTGQMVSIKSDTDKTSPTRSTEKRQRIRTVSEKMYEAGLKDAAMTRAKKAAAVGVGIGAVGASTAGSNKDEKIVNVDMKNKDERINPKDYPTYQKKTESATAFRDAFKKAKAAGKDTFSFEGRSYKVKDGDSQKMMSGGYATKKYNKGGYANCGASMKPQQKAKK
jgi:hypothetical protein